VTRHGKQHRLSSSSSAGVLDALHLSPGDCVSGDQLESTRPGLIPTLRGSPTTEKYHAGTLFVDHASRFLHFTPHTSTGSQEALNTKHRFELLAFHHNRSIKCYHTDNGIFASKDFRQSCLQQKQRIKFCGVNAHHQNGIAERHIRTITERARTMLIHAMLLWPEIIQEQLWPFAIRLSVTSITALPVLLACLPKKSSLASRDAPVYLTSTLLDVPSLSLIHPQDSAMEAPLQSRRLSWHVS
jgi:hypothetical protein